MIEKRLNELSARAFNRGIKVFSDFLNLDEQSILAKSNLPCVRYGGYPSAERVVAGFGDDVKSEDFLISIIRISPTNKRFAQQLTHRDFLGALMNLKIKRELLGDILIKDNEAYLFCLDRISDFIISELVRVNHTSVRAQRVESLPEGIAPMGEKIQCFVASLRLDAVISAVYKLSRGDSNRLIVQEKVFVNSKAITNTSYPLKSGDIISVRGFGRIEYTDCVKQTRKNRLVIELVKY